MSGPCHAVPFLESQTPHQTLHFCDQKAKNPVANTLY
jgi:hypothetical protein